AAGLQRCLPAEAEWWEASWDALPGPRGAAGSSGAPGSPAPYPGVRAPGGWPDPPESLTALDCGGPCAAGREVGQHSRRSGAGGGTNDNTCEFGDRECVHNQKYRLAKATGRISELETVLIPAVSPAKRGTSSWTSHYRWEDPGVTLLSHI